MTQPIIRVRDANGREFDSTATDARRNGWQVVADTAGTAQPKKTSARRAAKKKSPKAAVIDSESAPTSEGTD